MHAVILLFCAQAGELTGGQQERNGIFNGIGGSVWRFHVGVLLLGGVTLCNDRLTPLVPARLSRLPSLVPVLTPIPSASGPSFLSACLGFSQPDFRVAPCSLLDGAPGAIA